MAIQASTPTWLLPVQQITNGSFRVKWVNVNLANDRGLSFEILPGMGSTNKLERNGYPEEGKFDEL